MPLMEHLRELRNRLIKGVLGIILGMVVGWFFYKQAFNFISEPFCKIPIQNRVGCGPDGHPLIVTGVFDPFFVKLKVAFVVGLVVSSPIWFYQLWAFIAPGLTPEERRVVRPWVPIALLFFAIGIAVAWVVLPFALAFLFSFEGNGLTITLTVDNYFGFITTLFLAFGLTMQFPIVLYILSRVGIVTSQRLRTARRYVILGIAVFSTVITPGGDLVSPTVLGVTMYLLFEISIFVIRRSGR